MKTASVPNTSSSKDDGKAAAAGNGGKEAGNRMSEEAEAGMIMLSVVFAALAVWALCRTGDPPVTVVWRLSVLVSGCLGCWIGVLSGAGACTFLFRASYAALVALAVDNHMSAGAGMVVVFLEAVCVAGFFGYYLAVYTNGANLRLVISSALDELSC